ncbi:MAG: D-3-phosphoglycerate dehydrogenase [Myxococcales bacterium]|nr:D-3-phosphoglycerate dehydrogenase [Myxococcales bacterium]
MRVLFADKLPDATRTRLAAAGFEVRAEPALSGDALVARLGEFDPEILVVRSTRVTADHVRAGHSLSLVVRGGAGVNTIDIPACSARGVFVANCPGKNAVAVAELTIGLLLSLDRFIADNVQDLRNGQWNKARYAKGRGLRGRRLALLGAGAIGREVARRAQAFGMSVVAWSRSLTPEAAETLDIEHASSPDEAVAGADAVSVHLALTPETRGLIGDSVFEAMKHEAVFLNTSRAEVVDEASLLRALEAKGIRAGLDVFSDEPSTKEGPFDHPLARHASVYGTHHIGASTEEAQLAVGDEVARISEAFRDQGTVLNVVNSIDQTAATHRLVVRHLDQVGVLAHVFDVLKQGGINVQEMENIVFPGGAAIARIQVSSSPAQAVIDHLEASDAVLHVSAVAI